MARPGHTPPFCLQPPDLVILTFVLDALLRRPGFVR